MKQRYDCDACPAKRLGAGRWGYFFLHAQIRSPHSLYQPGLNPSVPKTLVGVILTTSTPPLAVKRHQFNPHSQPA
jgi:hypothetical protein